MYIFLVLGVLCIITAFIVLLSQRAKAKIIKEIRDNWGKPNEEYINFSNLFSLESLGLFSNFHRISEQTKNDISFNDLFEMLNRTASKVGEQYLYNLLQHPTDNIQNLQLFSSTVDYFSINVNQREDVQYILHQLNKPTSYNIAILLTEISWQPPHWYKFANWLTFSICITSVAFFFIPQAFILLMLLFAINVYFHFYNRQKSNSILKGLQQVSNLVSVSQSLQKINIPFKQIKVGLAIKLLEKFKRQNSFINFSATKDDSLGQVIVLIIELVKIFFLLDVHLTQKNIRTFFKKREAVITLFGYVGNLDSAISIASLRNSNPNICSPIFVPNNEGLKAFGLYHPLIKECVANNFNLDGNSMFITGSNMSGKSTFLRTVLINSIFAQTVCSCFAKSFTTPMLRQFSSIKIEDHLLQGKSYFLEEVSVMKNLLDESRNAAPGLFVIDEVFKGTNTVERIAAAKAVLNYLINDCQNFVLVSSHDLELLGLLDDAFLQYHFSENLINGKFIYDHKLKQGHVATTNAIRILEMYGYPASIISEAKQLKL